MNKRKTRKPGAIRDFFRLASAQDILAGAGRLMMRRSPRAMFWTAGITSSGYLSNLVGLPGFSALEAVILPLIIGLGMFAVGAGIRYVPRTLSGKLTTIAAANDLNLMEDYRKSQIIEHLNGLWDRVFWYESTIRYTAEQRLIERQQIEADSQSLRIGIESFEAELLERLGVSSDADLDDFVQVLMTERPLSDKMEKSRQGYIISSVYALRHALPQSSQAGCIGYRLNLYEDERDGGYFDSSDSKLLEQYIGNATLSDIKSDIGFNKIDTLKELPAIISRRFWFFLITRKVATLTGRAIKELNDKYCTDRFNSQVVLWPGEEGAKWLESLGDASEEVLKWRRAIVHSALGRTFGTASAVLDRMLLPCLRLATQLRFRYDPEYGDNSLDYTAEDTGRAITNNIADDLRTCRYGPGTIARLCRRAEIAAGQMVEFLEFLKSGSDAELFDDRLALRAVKIAFHSNADGLKDDFLSGKAALARQRTHDRISQIVAHKAIFSDRLVCLRLHHQLTILQLKGYRDLARKLAYSDDDDAKSELRQ